MGVNVSISFKYRMHELTPMVDNDSITFKYSMGINDIISFKYSMGVNDNISFKYSMGINDIISFKYSMGVMIALVLSIACMN